MELFCARMNTTEQFGINIWLLIMQPTMQLYNIQYHYEL